jgi:hypothetical protein
MGRITRHIAQRASRRRASIHAARNADPSVITTLPSMADRPNRFTTRQKSQYQLGVRDGVAGQLDADNHNPDYRQGYIAGKHNQDTPGGKYGPHGQWRQVVAKRRAAHPAPPQITAEMNARTLADAEAKATRQTSPLLRALRDSQA